MPIHYFHCTDGKNLILDRTGRDTRSQHEVEPVAFQIAGELMTRAPAPLDWSDWLVSVQDDTGSMVAVVPFPLPGDGPDAALRG
jgi:hypothetical protein